MIKKLLNLGEKVINELESKEVPFLYFILTFFFAVNLRDFLEIFSDFTPVSFEFFFHYDISYIVLALSLILLFYFVTKENIKKIAQVILPSFLILILAPILDLTLSWGKGYDMTYLLPEVHGNLLLRFITFFGSFNEITAKGITPGIRIEIILVLLASFIYFFIKKRSVLKSLIASFLTYCLIFIYLALPYFIKAFLNILKLEYKPSHALANNFYLVLLFILTVGTFYLYNRRYFLSISKDIRIFRLLHFELMFILGIVLAKIYSGSGQTFELNSFNLFYVPFVMIAILFAWLFSVLTNNLTDYNIDKISNKNRPTVSKVIPTKDYKTLSYIFLVLAILYSSIINFETLFLIVLFMGNYFLYSMPPLRLKRVLFLSKIFISLNSLILIMLGYFFVTANFNIPGKIIAFFLIGFTAVLNFIDLKDYEGDRREGIKTLPVLLGLKKSKFIIGLFSFILCISVYFLLKNIYFLPLLIILGLVQFFLINKKIYKEKPVFLVYLIGLFLLMIYLYFL